MRAMPPAMTGVRLAEQDPRRDRRQRDADRGPDAVREPEPHPVRERCGQAEEGEQVPADHHGVPLPATVDRQAQRQRAHHLEQDGGGEEEGAIRQVLSGRASAQTGIHLDQQDTGRDQGEPPP